MQGPAMKQPVLRDDAFIQDVLQSRSRERLNIWWLGQSGFLVQHGDAHLLLDPYLSDSLTKKYANTDKPHVRMTERVVAPERLDFVDVVTSQLDGYRAPRQPCLCRATLRRVAHAPHADQRG